MGEATVEDLFRWCDNHRSVLLGQYPGTHVEVEALADTSTNKISVEVDDDTSAARAKDTAHEVIRH
jgi:hypothetical protein